MPKKTKFTKEAVIEAGLEQLKDGGWESIKPRLVAMKLGASTMPIFSHFKTMEEFKTAILDRSWELIAEYASRSYTGDIWVDQGIGYVLFARDHGQIFNCMHYGKVEEIRERRMRFWEFASQQLEGHPTFEGLSAEHIGWIRHMRSLLTHGMAVSISSGFVLIWEDEDVVRKMLSLCSEILFEGLSANRDKLDEMTKKIPPELKVVLKRLRGRTTGN
jgi:AcrR family transcriptional regulator